jgi:rRNA maturation RNase YbeY
VPISFYSADVHYSLKNKASLEKFILQRFEKKTGKKLSLSVIFCSDEFLLNINQQFLQHHYYTDVITFPLLETKRKTTAEMYISLERIWENALTHKLPFEEELRRVLFHGTLHLMGFTDSTENEKRAMRKEEDIWLKSFHTFMTFEKSR